ncbi:Zinc finger MIZ-type [Penicillium cf. griseofulvum]|nr:Zinc finger MIZ-type [Penicillium cf. griseofulvum]
MVSPISRSHPSADHIEKSNTTASLFLGGTRRNWMGPQTNAPEKSATRNSRVELPPPNSLPRELVLMSPVTPATALPSPVLSTNSHPSPANNNAIVSDKPYTRSIHTQPTAQRGDDERMAVQPPPSALATSQRITQFSRMGPNSSTNSPVTGTHTGVSKERAISRLQPRPQQNRAAAAVAISNKAWEKWSVQLEALAISRKDAFYLVMHQLYCRYSIDPTTLGQIRAPEAGMDWMKRFLDDNRKMHDAATIGFAYFPEPPHQLMQTQWYLQVLSGIPEFLSRLETEWSGIWREPPHLPLASQLWEVLACPSPTLMSVIFMCVARRLHEEKDIRPLVDLFWKNYNAFKQCMDGELPETTQQDINSRFAQEYRKFIHSSEYLSHTPSSAHSVPPPRPHIQTMPQVAPGVPSPYPRSSVAGISQSAINSPAPSPLGAPLQQSTSNSPQRQVVGPAAGSFQFGTNSQVQNTPQYHYYNPMSQGQGQGQRQGQWYLVNSHTIPNMDPQLQMHMQAGRHQQISPLSHGPHMQHRAMGPTTSVAPVNSSLQSNALTSAQSAQSLHAPSPVFMPTTITHMAQHPMPLQRPSNHLNQHHSMTSPITRAPQGQHSDSFPNSTFLPIPGYRAPMMVNPNPTRLGLHLVDLRDPMKKLVKRGSCGNDIEIDLFTYPDTFAVYPTIVNVDQPIYTWNFSFNPDERQKFPHIAHGPVGQHSVWTFGPGCRTIRLRCIRLPGNPDTVTEQTWSTAATFWPSVFYITVNGQELYVRRKVHNGKDLPLDITEYVQTGANSLRVDMILGQDECKTSKYVFGVEVMEIAEFDQILSLIQSVPADDSRAAIQKRLSPVTNDDDLAVVTDNLTIDLVDPFMARIFDVPVRSRHCNHHECFDRDTFIRTRKSVSGPAPMVDNWRCPICKADARPQFLVVDQFLAEIHAQLTRTNQLDGIRAIQIKVDGTWTPKYDTDETSPDADKHFSLKRKAEDSPGPVAMRPRNDVSNGSRSPAVRTHEHTVIELD